MCTGIGVLEKSQKEVNETKIWRGAARTYVCFPPNSTQDVTLKIIIFLNWIWKIKYYKMFKFEISQNK